MSRLTDPRASPSHPQPPMHQRSGRASRQSLKERTAVPSVASSSGAPSRSHGRRSLALRACCRSLDIGLRLARMVSPSRIDGADCRAEIDDDGADERPPDLICATTSQRITSTKLSCTSIARLSRLVVSLRSGAGSGCRSRGRRWRVPRTLEDAAPPGAGIQRIRSPCIAPTRAYFSNGDRDGHQHEQRGSPPRTSANRHP
jgi:hypothetical protein